MSVPRLAHEVDPYHSEVADEMRPCGQRNVTTRPLYSKSDTDPDASDPRGV